MGFSRQEYWSGLPLPSPGDLPHPGTEPESPALQVVSLPPESLGKPHMHIFRSILIYSFPGGSVGKESAFNPRDSGSVPGSGTSPGEGNGNPLQYPYLGNLMDRRAWRATVHGVSRVRHKLVTKSPPIISAVAFRF